MKVYLYETFHRCNSLMGWVPVQCSIELSSTQKVEGAYSIKMTSDVIAYSMMRYNKNVDWTEFGEMVFWVYHPGYTNEIGWIGIYTDTSNYKIWEFDFAAAWTERTIDLTSVPDSSDGTLDLSNVTYITVHQQNMTDPGEDYYFDFFHGRSIDISSDVINPLSFIEHAVRDCPKLEFMAKGTWIPSRDYTIEILDYLTSNGETKADQIIFEGSITDYELTLPRKIWCVSRAKSDLDEFRPNGAYNGDLDSNHIKTLIAECSYITEGTIDATVGNTDNAFKGDKTFRTILNDWADKHLKHWYLSPTGALSFNDADVDSGAVLHYHKGTYNFKDEVVGTSGTDIGLIDSISATDPTYTGVIIASEDGHKKVLEVNASGVVGTYTMYYHNFSATQTIADIEFFIKFIDNGTGNYYFVVSDASNDLIKLAYLNSNNLLYAYHAATNTSVAVSPDTWTRVRVRFNTDTDRQWVWVNGVALISDVAFLGSGVSAGLTKCNWQTSGAAANDDLRYFLDAYGESWDANYTVGDNLKGDLFQCWNVKPKKHVDAINWVMLKGGIVAGTQISQESKDQNSIDELGPKIYKDTYAFITIEAQLLIAANNLRTREQLLPLAINLWSYEANRGLLQAGECTWFAQSKANPNVSPRQVIINKIIYRFLSGHTNLQTTDGIAFKKDKDKALPQENSLLLQQ